MFTGTGHGASKINLTEPMPGSGALDFHAACVGTGTFSVRSSAGLVFSTQCGTGALIGADVPLAQVDEDALELTADANSAWRLEAILH